jgi:hypothetical protein
MNPGVSDLQLLLVEEFLEAVGYSNRFAATIDLIANEFPDIYQIYIQIFEIEKRWFDITNDLRRTYLYKCPFCGDRKWIERGAKVPKTCGSGECDLKYKTQWEERNRPRKTSDPDGWVLAFDGTRKLCKGSKCDDGENEFGRLRQVNAEYLCRECFCQKPC